MTTREKFDFARDAYEASNPGDRAAGDRLHAEMMTAYRAMSAGEQRQVEAEEVEAMIDRWNDDYIREWQEEHGQI